MVESAMRIAGESERAITRRFGFTLKSLAAVKSPEAGRLWVYDSQVRNLGCMVTPTARSFYCVYKFHGRPFRYRLGDESLGVDQARKLAREATVKVANGVNPQAERQQARGEMTFGEVFASYMDRHSKLLKRTWREDQQKYDLHLKRWANRRFKDITQQDVSELHGGIGAGKDGSPGAANRVLALVSSVYNKSRTLKNYQGPNPAKGIQRFPENERERFLSPDELTRFMNALREENADWQDFFTLLLYSGVRAGNMKSAEWAEFDLSQQLWVIPARKFQTNRIMTVALADEAVFILNRRLKACAKGGDGNPESPYLFPAASATGTIREYRKAFERIRKSAKLNDLIVHDLRRTLGSWQVAAGASLSIIGRSLGHTQEATTRKYARLALEPVRQSVATAVSAMAKAGKAKK